MLDGLMEWGRNIVCFSVFSVLIRNLLPGEKYAPYVRLYMGFLMLLVFFTPILRVFDVEKTLYYLTDILGGVLEIKEDAFLASLEENSNYERQKAEYADRLEKSAADCVERELEGQGYCIERVEVRWEEEEEKEDFGAVTGITVYLKEKGEGDVDRQQDMRKITIEPVLVEVFSEWDKEGEVIDEGIGERLKGVLTECYCLEEEEIVIRMLE